MGRKVYGSGLVASDLASDRKPKVKKDSTTMRQHVSGPLLDEATRAKAAVNVRRLCPHDAEEMLDALGLLPGPARRSARSVVCPSCSAAAGSACHDTNSSTMGRPHAARSKAYREALDVPIEGDQQ